MVEKLSETTDQWPIDFLNKNTEYNTDIDMEYTFFYNGISKNERLIFLLKELAVKEMRGKLGKNVDGYYITEVGVKESMESKLRPKITIRGVKL